MNRDIEPTSPQSCPSLASSSYKLFLQSIENFHGLCYQILFPSVFGICQEQNCDRYCGILRLLKLIQAWSHQLGNWHGQASRGKRAKRERDRSEIRNAEIAECDRASRAQPRSPPEPAPALISTFFFRKPTVESAVICPSSLRFRLLPGPPNEVIRLENGK